VTFTLALVGVATLLAFRGGRARLPESFVAPALIMGVLLVLARFGMAG
jgi:hypothetical protein